MWNLTSLHLETMLVSVHDGAYSAPKVPTAQKLFWMHPMGLLGYEAQLTTHFGLFGDGANPDAS
jgi:hypothetical protein